MQWRKNKSILHLAAEAGSMCSVINLGHCKVYKKKLAV